MTGAPPPENGKKPKWYECLGCGKAVRERWESCPYCGLDLDATLYDGNRDVYVRANKETKAQTVQEILAARGEFKTPDTLY